MKKILDCPENNVLLWYKNSDHGSNAFCIPYAMKDHIRGRTVERLAPTYPDFIVLFKDGSIGIYEIKDYDKKDDKDSPKSEAINKTVLLMNRDIPGVRVFGGLVYIERISQSIRDKDKYIELF